MRATTTIENWRKSNRTLSKDKHLLKKKNTLLAEHNKKLLRDNQVHISQNAKLMDELETEKRIGEMAVQNFQMLSGNKLENIFSDLHMYRAWYIDNVDREI